MLSAAGRLRRAAATRNRVRRAARGVRVAADAWRSGRSPSPEHRRVWVGISAARGATPSPFRTRGVASDAPEWCQSATEGVFGEAEGGSVMGTRKVCALTLIVLGQSTLPPARRAPEARRESCSRPRRRHATRSTRRARRGQRGAHARNYDMQAKTTEPNGRRTRRPTPPVDRVAAERGGRAERRAGRGAGGRAFGHAPWWS